MKKFARKPGLAYKRLRYLLLNNIFQGSDTVSKANQTKKSYLITYDFLNNIIKSINEAHNEKVNSIDVNHENTLLASCSSDKLVKIWLLENFTFLKTLNKHKNAVNLIKVFILI